MPKPVYSSSVGVGLQGATSQTATTSRASRRWHRYLLAIVISVVAVIALILRFGGALLVASDPLPSHARVAVMLDGATNAVEARRAEAMRLAQEDVVDHVMLSVGQISYWGESIPVVARNYLERTYGPALASRVAFCPMDGSVNSTAEEAVVLERCLEQQGWRSVIVVTSNYHTRRARRIWRATLASAAPSFTVSVVGVPDGDFQPRGWFRKRRYAKTWIEELAKLTWTYVVGINRWK